MLENYRNGEFDDRIIAMHESLLNIAHHLNEDGYFIILPENWTKKSW